MVVIGLGSPYLRDDGVGSAVVRELALDPPTGVRLVEAPAGGILLLETLEGERSAVIVDALLDRGRRPGEVVLAGIDTATHHAGCSHDLSLPDALSLGRSLGMRLPADDDITLVAVVADDVTTFSESLTDPVREALPQAVAAVGQLISESFSPGDADYQLGGGR